MQSSSPPEPKGSGASSSKPVREGYGPSGSCPRRKVSLVVAGSSLTGHLSAAEEPYALVPL